MKTCKNCDSWRIAPSGNWECDKGFDSCADDDGCMEWEERQPPDKEELSRIRRNAAMQSERCKRSVLKGGKYISLKVPDYLGNAFKAEAKMRGKSLSALFRDCVSRLVLEGDSGAE